MPRTYSIAPVLAVVLALAPAAQTAHAQIARAPAVGLARIQDPHDDDSTAWSPDGRLRAEVRRTGPAFTGTQSDAIRAELWIVDTRTGTARLLVRGHASDDPHTRLVGLNTPRFSPDGRRVYFSADGWVTSGAIHAADVATGRTRYVAPGTLLGVVRGGSHAGQLVAAQHRYFAQGGSFDWAWLLTPQGADVAPIGEEVEPFLAYLEDEAASPAHPQPATAPGSASPVHR
ncbi:MAG TPA: hypothetical protein VFE05_06885 [Longimicrobiaceae bacterium]|jgi:hypothetical protein|nr:hypothetical protein [Longimicrobiaceae bacterium]